MYTTEITVTEDNAQDLLIGKEHAQINIIYFSTKSWRTRKEGKAWIWPLGITGGWVIAQLRLPEFCCLNYGWVFRSTCPVLSPLLLLMGNY